MLMYETFLIFIKHKEGAFSLENPLFLSCHTTYFTIAAF